MNLRDLKYLIALVENQHFGKAADACFVSQPTLSMQIKKLEETLGVSLLERRNRSFILTEIGEKVANKARDILYHVEVMKDLAKQSQNPYEGEIYVGIIPTLAPYLLPYLVKGLSEAFPDLKIYWVEKQTHLLVEALNDGKLDAAFLALPAPDSRFSALPLFEEEFLLATYPSHPLKNRKLVKAEEIAEDELLLLEEGHCLRDQSLTFCHQQSIEVSKKFEATSLETLRHMVRAKMGITLMPKLASKVDDDLNYLTFSGDRPSRKVGLCYRPSTGKRTLISDFSENVRRLLEEQSAKTGLKACSIEK